MEIKVLQDILSANDAIARRNQTRLDKHGILTINIMSSPGTGKTSLVLQTIRSLTPEMEVAVIEGDVASSIDADKVPVNKAVAGACELLGFDPLYVANEGKLVAIVAPADADKVLNKMKQNRYGHAAAIIGEVVKEHPKRVVLKTRLGASRIIDMLVDELLPRIC